MVCTSSLPSAFASSHNGEASLQPNPSPIHTGGYCLDHRTTSPPTWAGQEPTGSTSSLEYSNELYLEDFESEYDGEDDQHPNTPVCQSDIDDDHFDADNEPDEQFEAISGVHYILDGMASTVDAWLDFEYDSNYQYAATPEGFEVMNQNNYYAYMQVYGSLMDVIDNVSTIRVFHEMVDWVAMILMVWRAL
ncbi:hypothetical protein LTR05_006768 [Lithohypha guttulata]|uniref:Uncharacterized protein n=1 Tax=Lithohypha guttulata TaxID=1690604 RepID=A0AAN7SVT6_9EURO|nr:hypothetical protein LTR05_006768 [Lithohypha guttulata]